MSGRGFSPAPYLARAQWIALEQLNTLPDSELRELLAESYRLVFERLPKKRQQELQGGVRTAQRKTGVALRRREAAAKKKHEVCETKQVLPARKIGQGGQAGMRLVVVRYAAG